MDRILNLGVEGHHSPNAIRTIRTVNSLNLVVAFFLLVGFGIYFAGGAYVGLFPGLVFLSLHIGALFLSRLHKTRLAFLVFTITVNCSIFYINQLYPPAAGAYLYYFPLIVSVVLLNNPSFRDGYTVAHYILCVLFFVTSLLVAIPGLRLNVPS